MEVNNYQKHGDGCERLFQESINNLHSGLLEIQRGAAQIVGDRGAWGKAQIEKGIVLAALGKCQVEKAIAQGCVRDAEKTDRFNRGLADIKTGMDGLNIGLASIPEFWSDNANHWLGCMVEVLSGMIKVGSGHNIVLEVWGELR